MTNGSPLSTADDPIFWFEARDADGPWKVYLASAHSGDWLYVNSNYCADGITFLPTRTIYICAGLSEEQMALTVVHELLHAARGIPRKRVGRRRAERFIRKAEP